MEENQRYQYDVALSFAGEDREYVEEVALFLQSYGINVFYDKFEQANLWGKNLYEYLQDIYKNKAKYSIIFISENYKKKAWTNHERESAQARAFEESKEYILPIKLDDTEIVGIHSTVGYLDGRKYSAKEISKLFLEKNNFSTIQRWWGNWDRESHSLSYNGNLFISDVTDKGFTFSLIAQNGAHTGDIEDGYATFTSIDEAVYEEQEYKGELCAINFSKINNTMQLKETNCSFMHGMRAYFDGTYSLEKDIFQYHTEVITDKVLSRIYKILGEKYWISFLKCFNDTHEGNDIDGFNAKILRGGSAGFYTIYESIIISNDKDIWGAFLDVDEIYYFTTDINYKKKLPNTIIEWIENFKSIEVTYLE
jgi:hypothetical protein